MKTLFQILSRKKFRFIFLFATLIVAATSCQQPEVTVSEKPYFDVTKFFNEQVIRLQKDSLVVLKTSSINTNTDQHQMDWTDWKRELALFLASDINKASLIGKYTVDTNHITSGEDSGSIQISYLAEDSSLHTRLLEVKWKNGEVKEVHIINKTQSFLSSSSENLLYLPMKAYLIKTSTDNRFFGGNDFSVMGEITTKEKKYF